MKSISDFAESLMEQDLRDLKAGKPIEIGPKTSSDGSVPGAPDISKISVPDEFIQEITGIKNTPVKSVTQQVKAKPVKPKAKIQESKQPSIEEAIVSLLLDISKKLNTLCEMTTTGNLGVNTCDTPAVKPKKKKKKTKSELVRESLRDILNNRHGKI